MKKLLTLLLLLAGPVLAVNKFDDVRVVKSLTLDEGIVFTIGPTAGEALKVALGIDQFDEQLALKAPIDNPVFTGSLTATGPANITGDLTVSGVVRGGSLSSDDNLAVYGATYLANDAFVVDGSGNLTTSGNITATSLTAATITSSGGLDVTGNANVDGDLGVVGSITGNGITSNTTLAVTGAVTGASFSATGYINSGTGISTEGTLQTSSNLSVYAGIDAGDYRFIVDNDGNVRSYGGISSASAGPDYAGLGSDVNAPRVSLGNNSIAAEFGINLTGTVDPCGLPTGYWGLATSHAYGLVLKTPSTIDLISNGSNVTINGGRVSSVNAIYQDANSILNAGASDLRYAQSSVTNSQAITQEAVDFDGTNYASISPATPVLGLNWSAACWVYPRATGAYPRLIGLYGVPSPEALGFGSGDYRLIAFDGAALVSTTDEISPNQWSHIASVCNAGTVTFYKNGAPMAGGGTIGSMNYQNAICGSDSSPELNASVARACIFNRALSAGEVAALYARGGLPFPEELGASQTALNTSVFIAAFGLGSGTLSAATTTGFTVTGGTAGGVNGGNFFSEKKGQKFRVTMTVAGLSGYITVGLVTGTPAGASTVSPNITTNGTHSFELTATETTGVMVWVASGGTWSAVVSNFSVVPIGTLFAMDDGSRSAGFQVADISGNGKHLNLPATGVKIVHPDTRGGVYRATTTGTAPVFMGRIPKLARINSITISGFDSDDYSIGTTSGAVDIANNIPFATNPFDVTLLKRFTSTGELYVDNLGVDGWPVSWTVDWSWSSPDPSGQSPTTDDPTVLPAP